MNKIVQDWEVLTSNTFDSIIALEKRIKILPSLLITNNEGKISPLQKEYLEQSGVKIVIIPQKPSLEDYVNSGMLEKKTLTLHNYSEMLPKELFPLLKNNLVVAQHYGNFNKHPELRVQKPLKKIAELLKSDKLKALDYLGCGLVLYKVSEELFSGTIFLETSASWLNENLESELDKLAVMNWSALLRSRFKQQIDQNMGIKMELTFGAELEMADWSRDVEIPRKLGVKDVNDMTVANSDGTCVYPYDFKGKGGEICTNVFNSPKDLAIACEKIIGNLDRVSINHTCWLHIHVGIPKFDSNNLTQLKKIAAYVYKNSQQIRDYTSICPVKEGKGMTAEARIRRNLTRTSVMTESEFNICQNASTVDEFWEAFTRKRHLVNITPLKYQGTIEFRCFYMTLDVERIKDAARFARDFVDDMFKENPIDVVGILEKNTYLFPKAIKFNSKIEKRYLETLVEKRAKVDNFTLKPWGEKQ